MTKRLRYRNIALRLSDAHPDLADDRELLFDELIADIPIDITKSLHWQPGDKLQWFRFKGENNRLLKNVSVRVLYASNFRRDFNSLRRSLLNELHPLQRVVIEFRNRNREAFVLVPLSALTGGTD